MALFPNVPYGSIQSGLGASLIPVSFRYAIKRRNIQRTTVHVFADLSEQRYLKGAPLAEFEMTFRDLLTGEVNMIRNFYQTAQADVLPWSMNLDNLSFYNCRFVGTPEYSNTSQGLWECVVRARGFNADQNQSTVITAGPGARILYPAAAGSVTVAWDANWNQVTPSYDNGTIQINFDGAGGATIQYIPNTGGGENPPFGTNFIQQWGIASGTWLVSVATPGPVSLGTGFVTGQELTIFMTTTGGLLTNPGTVFASGPAFRNGDGQIHATVI
jgi:hypothetical protein